MALVADPRRPGNAQAARARSSTRDEQPPVQTAVRAAELRCPVRRARPGHSQRRRLSARRTRQVRHRGRAHTATPAARRLLVRPCSPTATPSRLTSVIADAVGYWRSQPPPPRPGWSMTRPPRRRRPEERRRAPRQRRLTQRRCSAGFVSAEARGDRGRIVGHDPHQHAPAAARARAARVSSAEVTSGIRREHSPGICRPADLAGLIIKARGEDRADGSGGHVVSLK